MAPMPKSSFLSQSFIVATLATTVVLVSRAEAQLLPLPAPVPQRPAENPPPPVAAPSVTAPSASPAAPAPVGRASLPTPGAAPAATPVPTPKPTAKPTPVVKPTATAKPAPTAKPTPLPDTVLLDNPPSEAPMIIGEPVRKQAVKPAPGAARTTPQRAPKASPASVSGIDITGMSDGEAVKKLQTNLEKQLNEPIRLVIGDYQYTFLRSELGATIPYWPLMRAAKASGGNVPLRLQADAARIEKELRTLDAQVREDFDKMGLNIGASIVRVKMALESAPPRPAVELVTMRIEVPKATPAPTPEPSKAEAVTSAKVGSGKYPYLLADFSTRYDASLRGRTTNLRMAAKNINGTVVPAGSTFSTNNSIGPRNAAAGWREAQMFVSGRVVSGTGAGICQAASTLYNAALLGNFPIVERHPHSMRVMYVPPSRDAALMWGSKDFKFRNTTGAPILVETSVAGGKFHARIWGQKPRVGAPVQVVSRVLSRAGGTKSEAYKVVGGQKIRLSRDSYKPHP